MKTSMLAAACCAAFFTASTSFADSMKTIMVTDAWSRVTTPSAKVGAGYLSLSNHSETDDHLIGVEAPHASKTEVHTMHMKDDVMVMRPLALPLEVKAGQSIDLKPGGNHLMFMQLQSPHVTDEPLTAILVFEKAGPVEVVFEVLSMRDAMAKTEHQSPNHDEAHDSQGMSAQPAEWGTQ